MRTAIGLPTKWGRYLFSQEGNSSRLRTRSETSDVSLMPGQTRRFQMGEIERSRATTFSKTSMV